MPLQWRHNERVGVSNHRRLDCLLNRLLRHRSKKTSKLRVTSLCEGNPSVTGGFPLGKTSNTEKNSFCDVIMTYFYFNRLHAKLLWGNTRDIFTLCTISQHIEKNAGIETPSRPSATMVWPNPLAIYRSQWLMGWLKFWTSKISLSVGDLSISSPPSMILATDYR